MTKSLHKFCKDNGLAKSSVHAKAKDLGLDTSNGLDSDAQATLLKAFSKVPEPATNYGMVLSAPSK